MVQMAESVLYTYDTAILQFADLTAEVSEKKSDYCHPIMSTFSLKYVAYRHMGPISNTHTTEISPLC